MIDSRFEQGLHSTDRIDELRKLAQSLLDDGGDTDSVLEQFERCRQVLRRENREDEEDAVTDVMDFLVGWCSPHMKLPRTPANE